jgi:hypothetical protein
LATTTWKGGAGNFAVGSQWTQGAVPGPGDVAVFDASSGSANSLLTTAVSVAGLTLDDPAATLTLAGDLFLNLGTFNALAGTLVLSGTLEGGTLALGGASLVISNVSPVDGSVVTPVLRNLTVSGSLDLGDHTTLAVEGLRTGSLQNLRIGAGSTLVLLGAEQFTGLNIELAGGTITEDETDTNTGQLTIDYGTVVTQDAAGTTARIGPSVHLAMLGLGAVTNYGTIIAKAGILQLDAEGGSFTSTSHLGPFTNQGTIEIDAGATVVLNTVATLAGLGTLVSHGGLLDLKGSLDLTGATLDIGAANAFQNLRLDGVVTGGAIVEDGGALAVGTASLIGVAVMGSGFTFDTLTVGAGTTLNASGGAFVLTASDAAFGQIVLQDGADLANARIAYGGAQYRVQIDAIGGPTATATLAASTVINVGAGQVLVLDAGEGALINNAVINVAAGGRLEFDNAGSYVAGGTLNLSAGATVVLNGTIGLDALAHIVGSGANLINTGTLDLKGGSISTAGDAHFSSFVNEGTVTNGTLITVAGQNPNLSTIKDGTLITGAGVLPVNEVTLNNATVKGDVRLAVNGTLAITGDTRFSNADGTGPGSVVLNEQPKIFVQSAATSILFEASATLSNANVLLSGLSLANWYVAGTTSVAGIPMQNGSTATFASDTTVIATTVNGPISIIGGNGLIVNKGHIVVTPGADLFVTPYGSKTAQEFVNQGVVEIAAGGVFDVFTNVSMASLGTIQGQGLLRLDNPGDYYATPYDNTGNTLHVGGGAPDLELDHATISGGVIQNDGGEFSSIEGGTLSNVVYKGALHVGSAKDIFGVTREGELTFQGGALNSQSVTVDAGASLALGADQVFAGATISLAGFLTDTGHTLSFDAATTVSINGVVNVSAQHILNASTIRIGPGASLSLNDASSATTPETSTAGTIAVNGGTFFANALSPGQTLDLGPSANVSIGRYDPGSTVAFDAPNTLTLAKGTAIGSEVRNFGVGDAFDLSGYFDFSPTGVSASYDGQTVTVSSNGAALAAIKVGAGYDPAGFHVAHNSLFGFYATDYVLTYSPPGQPAPTPPGIAGALANQAIADVQTTKPFAGVTLSEATDGATMTVIVTQSGGGVLSAPGGGEFNPAGTVWSVTGSRAAVQAALAALVFTPTAHAVAPGQIATTGFTVSVSDATGTATDNSTSVVATAVEDPLLVSGASSRIYVSDTDNNAQPLHQIVLSDPDNAAYSAMATLSGAAGTSFAHSYAATIDSNGVFHTSGTLATVQQALRDLVVYTAAHQVPTGQSTQAVVTYSISNGASQTVGGSSTIDIAATGVPSAAGMYIAGGGPGQAVADTDTINPFRVVAVVDPSNGLIDTVTVTLSDSANGVLSDPLGGVFSNGVFTYTATTPDNGQFAEDIDKVLAALVFTPTLHQVALGQTVTTGFTVTVSNSLGSTTDASTSVIATSSTGVLSIGGTQANQEFSDSTTALPLSGVALYDTTAGATETATVTLSNPAAGALASGAGGAVGSDGIFRVSGGLAAVQAALQGLKFRPAFTGLGQVAVTGLTVTLSDGAESARDDATSLIVIGASANVSPPPAPTVSISPVGVINHAVAAASGGVALSGAVSGLAAGATFQVSVADGAFAKTYTATVDGSGSTWRATIPRADAILLPDGTAVVSSTVANAGGHASASVDVTVAETLPIVTISPVDGRNVIDSAAASAAGGIALTGTVTGLAAGATFAVKLTDGAFVRTYTAKVNAAGSGWSATMPSADASALSNGTALLSAQATDAYGNASAMATDEVLVNLSGTAVGDVHMVTYDGLRYDFQADGTFILTRSTTPGDPFQIQIVTSPFPRNNAASMTTQVAAQLGHDVLLFDTGAKMFVSVDGVADTALGAGNATQVFAGGKLVEVSATEYRVEWNSGETLSLKDNGFYIDTSVALGPRNGPGSVQGLLGPDEGQARDFQLPDGTVLAQPLSDAEILGVFAQAWSVTPADTLFGGGSTPLGFAVGSAGHEVIKASAPGDVLTAGSGGEILSDAGGFGASFRGSLGALSGNLLAGFSSKDVIDVSGLDAAHTTLSYAGSSAMGVLTLSDGRQTGELYLAGALSGGSFHVASDALGGARITFG